jgi:hypothetical protein
LCVCVCFRMYSTTTMTTCYFIYYFFITAYLERSLSLSHSAIFFFHCITNYFAITVFALLLSAARTAYTLEYRKGRVIYYYYYYFFLLFNEMCVPPKVIPKKYRSYDIINVKRYTHSLLKHITYYNFVCDEKKSQSRARTRLVDVRNVELPTANPILREPV